MSRKSRVTMMVAFCAAFVPSGNILAATLSGRVYEGNTGDESKPLAGVTVTLYRSNNSGQQGTYITSATTNSDGWYGLEAEGTYWFSVTAIYTDPLPVLGHPWGRAHHAPVFGTGASFIDCRARPKPEWRPVRDPADRLVDTSFTLFTWPE